MKNNKNLITVIAAIAFISGMAQADAGRPIVSHPPGDTWPWHLGLSVCALLSVIAIYAYMAGRDSTS